MILLIFDTLLVLFMGVLAWRALNDRDLFRAIIKFITFGLLMAVAWVRLGAPVTTPTASRGSRASNPGENGAPRRTL